MGFSLSPGRTVVAGCAGRGKAKINFLAARRAALTAPAVTEARLEYETAPHVVRFDLSEPTVNGHFTVGFALGLTRLDTGQTLPVGTFSSFSIAGGALTYTVSAQAFPGGVLPDGRYRATLAGNTLRDAAGNVRAEPYSFEFTFLRGDANGDGLINLADFNRLAINFGQSPRTFSQGDFNYDGQVTLADFNLLAARFGTSVSPPASDPSGRARDSGGDPDDPLAPLLK